MTLAAFLTLSGTTGNVRGSARQKGREGKIFVTAFDHTILAERQGPSLVDPLGMPTSKRRHGVFIITKPLDRSTPFLHRAHSLGAPFSSFVLECWRIPPAGGGPSGVNEENHWTVTLEGARIATIRTLLANVRIPLNAPLPEHEEVEFTYDKIQFKWQALTGNAGEVYQQTSPNLNADFSKQSVGAVVEQMVGNWAQKFGEEAGKQLGDFLKKEGKKLLQDAAKGN